MRRRELLLRLSGASLLAIPAVRALTGCGGDDDDDGGPIDAATVDAAATDAALTDAHAVDANAPDAAATFIGETSARDTSFHTHTFTISCGDLGGATLSVTAIGSGHTHTFNLDMTQLQTLAEGGTVRFDTNDSHAHKWVVTGSC